jgi:hypothetical protein
LARGRYWACTKDCGDRIEKKTEFFFIIGREKNPMNLKKQICKNKQGVAEELGTMIVRKKSKKKSGK